MVGTITAIVARFSGTTALKNAFPNGLWIDEFPAKNEAGVVVDIEVNGPFAAFKDGGATIENTSEISYIERRGFTFFVFALGAAATETTANLIRAAYKDMYKASDGVDWLKFELTGEKLFITDEPTKSGKRVYCQQLDYESERNANTADW